MTYSRELINGALKPIILQLLSNTRSLYGSEMRQKVSEKSLGKIAFKDSALYPCLQRMHAADLVSFIIYKSEGGKITKHYRITQKGRDWLEMKKKELKSFHGTMSDILLLNTK